MTKNAFTRLSALEPWIAAGIAVALAVPVLSAMHRGFDLSDESYYLLSARWLDAPTVNMSYFGVVVRALFPWLGEQVLDYRYARLVSGAIGVALLTTGLAPLVRGPGQSRPLSIVRTAALVATGAWVSYFFGPLTISYNSLTHDFVLAACGLALISSRSGPESRWRLLACGAALGFVVLMAALVKATSGAVLAVFCALLVVAARPRFLREGRAAVAFCAAISTGVLFAAALFFATFGHPAAWADHFATSFRAFDAAQFSPLARAVGNVRELGSVLAWLLRDLLPLGLSIWIAHRVWRALSGGRRAGPPSSDPLAWGWAILGIVQALRRSLLTNPTPYSVYPLLIVVVTSLAIAALARSRRASGASVDRWGFSAALFLGLLILPLASALGTTNRLLVQAAYYATPWFALFAWATGRLSAARHAPLALALTLALGTVAAKSVWQNLWVDPFRFEGTLSEQTAAVPETSALDGIRVHPNLASSIREVLRVVESETDYERGDPAISYGRTSGLIYLIGAEPIGYVYNSGWSVFDEANCRAVAARAERLGEVTLVIASEMPSSFSECLADAGLELGSEFTKTTIARGAELPPIEIFGRRRGGIETSSSPPR